MCRALPTLHTTLRLRFIVHRTEHFKPTNTAKLAAAMLPGATLEVHGGREGPSHAPEPGSAHVLFPSEHAISLERAISEGLRTLIVPDGTWTQARRIARRHAACREQPKVRLDTQAPSGYRLRRNPPEDGVCTLEAVAFVLRILEGDGVADAMLTFFEEWVRRSEHVRAGAHSVLFTPT